jgi:hypothetical protein
MTGDRGFTSLRRGGGGTGGAIGLAVVMASAPDIEDGALQPASFLAATVRIYVSLPRSPWT